MRTRQGPALGVLGSAERELVVPEGFHNTGGVGVRPFEGK